MSKRTDARANAEDNTIAEHKGSSNNQLLMTVLVVLIGLLAYHLVTVRFADADVAPATSTAGDGVKGIVVVDSKAIFGAYLNVMEQRIANSEPLSEARLEMSGQEFAADYLRSLKKYRDAGYIVMDKANVLAEPHGSSITQAIAKHLDLKVEEQPDPFLAPELSTE